MGTTETRQKFKYLLSDGKISNFQDYILLLPAVSVGNVGQLALDVLLENLQPQALKIGQLFHDAVESVIGNGGSGSLMTACELFQHAKLKIVALQFHAPVTKKHEAELVDFLVTWIKSCSFKTVVCLGSSLASLRNDLQLSRSSLHYLAGKFLPEDVIQKIQSLGWIQLESCPVEDLNGKVTQEIRIPGGGISRDVFLACETQGIPMLTLILFASDGDNTQESLALVEYLNQLYKFITPSTSSQDLKLRIPPSWEYFNWGVEPATSIF